MKTLKESILDSNIEQRSDEVAELHQIWKDLTETYGSMIRHWDILKLTVDNIAFDKKGHIIFVNWPMNTIDFDMQIDGMPDSVLKRGFGEFNVNVNIYGAYGNGKRECKLSSLGFITPSKTKLAFHGSKIYFDACPKFKEIEFWECFITDPMKLPKTQPKNCTIMFNEGTVANIGYLWARDFFKTYDIEYGGKLVVKK